MRKIMYICDLCGKTMEHAYTTLEVHNGEPLGGTFNYHYCKDCGNKVKNGLKTDFIGNQYIPVSLQETKVIDCTPKVTWTSEDNIKYSPTTYDKSTVYDKSTAYSKSPHIPDKVFLDD